MSSESRDVGLANEVNVLWRAGKRAVLALGAVTLCAGAALAQSPSPSVPSGPKKPPAGTDPGIVTKPPTGQDPDLATRPPRKVDPEMIQAPPAHARPDASADAKRRAPSSQRSREDDCRGSAADCKQSSAR